MGKLHKFTQFTAASQDKELSDLPFCQAQAYLPCGVQCNTAFATVAAFQSVICLRLSRKQSETTARVNVSLSPFLHPFSSVSPFPMMYSV